MRTTCKLVARLKVPQRLEDEKLTWNTDKWSSSYRAVNTLRLGYKNQPVNAV
jgi:hypothetical protein